MMSCVLEPLPCSPLVLLVSQDSFRSVTSKLLRRVQAGHGNVTSGRCALATYVDGL